MQVRSVLVNESTNANRACCASLMLLISRVCRSSVAAMRSSTPCTSLSRPANSRWIEARMKVLGFAKPPSLAACSTRAIKASSKRSPRHFVLALTGLTPCMAPPSGCVTEACTIVHKWHRYVHERCPTRGVGYWENIPQPRHIPLCSTTGLCGWYRLDCGSARKKIGQTTEIF